MTKIVYNACFGGFSLSHAAIMRYAEIKGIKLYPEKEEKFSFVNYWTVPPSDRPRDLSQKEFSRLSQEERIAHNKAQSEAMLSSREIPRDDPALAQVVEELADAANGMCAALRVTEVPKGTLYRIDEYDGRETVETKDTYDWNVA